jgi:hypothetical protein
MIVKFLNDGGMMVSTLDAFSMVNCTCRYWPLPIVLLLLEAKNLTCPNKEEHKKVKKTERKYLVNPL